MTSFFLRMSWYSVMVELKQVLAQMPKSLGLTWAQHGIRANNIAAGMTGFMKNIPD